MAFIAIVGLANDPSAPEKPLLEFSYQLLLRSNVCPGAAFSTVCFRGGRALRDFPPDL
ncbi:MULTISPECIES: hypothetical protein [Streptomyces]|uniref:Uncharacterized protein n=1 Tax=Streptomyces achmelvichensis TaxID=3134111 RepID=A0ACC6Q0F9_9ACTN|nr:hypothetical protein OG317_23675 [Streptomyces sp. NBC_01167]